MRDLIFLKILITNILKPKNSVKAIPIIKPVGIISDKNCITTLKYWLMISLK